MVVQYWEMMGGSPTSSGAAPRLLPTDKAANTCDPDGSTHRLLTRASGALDSSTSATAPDVH